MKIRQRTGRVQRPRSRRAARGRLPESGERGAGGTESAGPGQRGAGSRRAESAGPVEQRARGLDSAGPAPGERGAGGTAPYRAPEAHSYTSASQTQTSPGGALSAPGQGETGGQDRLPDALGWW